MDRVSINLAQLVADVKITIQNRYELPVWVVAEISELNLNRSGHCYIELVEKDAISDKIIAKCRATIWAFTFRTIKAFFETTTGETFRAGLKVLLSATIEFHEVYGFSLNVVDIDPRFTLGDLAQKRVRIIEQLDEEGVLDMNKSLTLPIVPQRIAVISSETAAGYGDFSDQLRSNPNAYKFYTELFPGIMQGEKAAESIVQALEQIYNRIEEFDVVVIIRGGGSKSDLSCFDDYDLAYFITQFPLPVVTGIGHERDDTVTDIVAHTKLKTPTAVAEYFIGMAVEFHQQLDEYVNIIEELSYNIFDKNEYLLDKHSQRLKTASFNLIQNHQEFLIWAKSKVINGTKQLQLNKLHQLNTLRQNVNFAAKSAVNQEFKLCELRTQRLGRWVNNYFNTKNRQLEFLHDKAEWVNPENILKKGYALVSHHGNKITHSEQLKRGDVIVVKLAKGTVDSEVVKIQKG